MALNEIHAILKRTRYGTGSQWSDLSSGGKQESTATTVSKSLRVLTSQTWSSSRKIGRLNELSIQVHKYQRTV